MKAILIPSLLSMLIVLASATAGCKPKGGGAPVDFVPRVVVQVARAEPIEERLSLVASISANEAVDIKSEIDGAVDAILFSEGQPAAKEQLLMTLDHEKLAATVAQAEANYTLAHASRQRAEAMFASKTIAQQELDQAIATDTATHALLSLLRRQLADCQIKAPFDGITGARLVSPGQVIAKNTTLTRLVDIQPVRVEFRVPERFSGRLSAGQAIEFSVPAWPGETFRGEVYFIDPEVDASTRTVLIKAYQQNDGAKLRPGMFGNLDLILRVENEGITVPETAITMQGDRAVLFTVDAESIAQMNVVTTGSHLPGRVQITSGLKGGETVIVEGVQKARPGGKVQPAAQTPAAP